jgi:hypothetical protein
VSVIQSSGGNIICDKTKAKYGEKVTLIITPEEGKYGVENSLTVNNSEIYRGRIFKETEVSFYMPHTDAQISMSFADDGLIGNGLFGDFDMDTKARGSDRWVYTGSTLSGSTASISLKGTGDATEKRDIAYTYCGKESDYFLFSCAAKITYTNINDTYQDNIGVFFGDGDAMGRIGYSLNKYTAKNAFYIRRNYTSLGFPDGTKKVNSGFLAIMAGQKDDGTDDTVTENNTIATASHGITDIQPSELGQKVMRMGFVYDGKNKKIHILLSEFSSDAGYNDTLVYVRTIENLDEKYFSVDKNGQVHCGLYAEAANTVSVQFYDFKYSVDKAEIESLYPQIRGN